MARKKKENTVEPKQRPTTQEIVWQSGQPEKPGLYDCMVNGRRATLQFKKCPFTGRKYWMYVDGSDVDPNAEVKWHDGKLFML